ncbi:MAG TPA: hypothetical protein PKH65_06425 [Bacteroidia bacterium]|nr:hypothetical protein [Bacteroidia bacterium]HNT80302.1 hypothetical protein [Bacteroidia bacterium]
MDNLSKNWLTERTIDFEYKKYVLLAYLKSVSESFQETKLYPSLAQLIEHYRALIHFQENKQNLNDKFPKQISSNEIKKFRLIYQEIIEDDEIMQELESIINYSIPQFEHYLAEGKKIYEFIESKTNIFPIGIVPIRNEEGYVMIQNGTDPETRVYEYCISIYTDLNEKYRSIAVNYVCSYEKNLNVSFESIKSDLLLYHKKLPNPAAYAIECEFQFPFDETLLPISKRMLIRYLSNASVH